MTRPTKAQQKALLDLYNRRGKSQSHWRYLRFRRSAWFSWKTLMVEWCGMIVGIEPDGYTHS